MTARNDASPDDLRALGWNVAAHLSYRSSGIYACWILTNGTHFIKGEGLTDAEALNNARAAIAAIQVSTQPTWRPISEAPKDRTEVLLRHIAADYTSDVVHSWWVDHEQRWARWVHTIEPTHFMLIPHAPKVTP